MALADATPEGLSEMGRGAVSEAKKLADWMVDIILFGCTSGSFVGGMGYDESIIEELEEAVGLPATTTTTCVLAALEDLGVKKIALVGPYLREVFDLEVQFLQTHGIETLCVKAFGYREVHEFVRLYEQPYLFYHAAKEAYQSARDIDAIFITCMASPALEVIEILERETGKPVLSSCSASLYGVLKKLEIREPIERYGRLGKRLGGC
jgi:maleate isomerase